MEGKKHIEVVAAAIIDGQRVLVTQRGHGQFKGGWEFPGGKLEPNELPEQAVVREIREELQLEVYPFEHIGTIDHDYPTFSITLHCFACQAKAIECMTLTEHQQAAWLSASEMDALNWLDADKLFINDIKKLLE